MASNGDSLNVPFGQQEQGYCEETSHLVVSGRYDPTDGDSEDEEYVVLGELLCYLLLLSSHRITAHCRQLI